MELIRTGDLMSPTEQFIDKFLEKRGLSEPNGQRLHEYCCGDREYRELRSLLRDHGDPERLRRPLDGFGGVRPEDEDWQHEDTDNVMPCFVLYASEWCRRWDKSRRRTWGELLDKIRWDRKNYAELYPAMVDGLNRWKRPVIRMPGSTRYFDTIAHEGGIPIEGLAVTEYRLVSQDERQARYEPHYQPDGFKSGGIQLKKQSDEDAPQRIIGLFDTSSHR